MLSCDLAANGRRERRRRRIADGRKQNGRESRSAAGQASHGAGGRRQRDENPSRAPEPDTFPRVWRSTARPGRSVPPVKPRRVQTRPKVTLAGQPPPRRPVPRPPANQNKDVLRFSSSSRFALSLSGSTFEPLVYSPPLPVIQTPIASPLVRLAGFFRIMNELIRAPPSGAHLIK